MGLLTNVFRPEVVDQKGLRKYVISVTLFAWIIALAVDVVNQLTFFSTWADAWREWSITSGLAIAIAAPIALSMGRAHLELGQAKRAADVLSRTDPLTGLANRRAFYEAAARLSGAALVLAIVDIDRFKRVNDRYGHVVGDEVIKAMAQRMLEVLGDLGTIARMGGEEFALICANLPPGELPARLERFCRRVAEAPVIVGDRSIYITVSIGFVARDDLDFDSLYAAADKALYVAKAAGRDRVVDFDQIGDITPAATEPALRTG